MIERTQLRVSLPERDGFWLRLPTPVRVSTVMIFTMLLACGIYVSWFDALAVAAVVGPLESWRSGLFGEDAARRWAGWILHWSLLIRFLALVVISYLIAYLLASALFSRGSFRVVLAGALLRGDRGIFAPAQRAAR